MKVNTYLKAYLHGGGGGGHSKSTHWKNEIF